MTFSKSSQASASAPSLGELLRMQRQLQQESRSLAPADYEESDSLSFSGGLRSLAAAPRGSNRASRSMNNVRSILDRAFAVLDEYDEEIEDVVGCSSRDESNA
jgi:hypothetical protein